MINSFRNDYFFLSNMYPCKVVIGGIEYSCSEAAFQAVKLENKKARIMFSGISGKEAKALGRRVALRPDWNEIRIKAMKEVVKRKFLQNPDLLAKLIATGEQPLIESNTWNDRFWGVCNGSGKNNLGKILMELRDELND